ESTTQPQRPSMKFKDSRIAGSSSAMSISIMNRAPPNVEFYTMQAISQNLSLISRLDWLTAYALPHSILYFGTRRPAIDARHEDQGRPADPHFLKIRVRRRPQPEPHRPAGRALRAAPSACHHPTIQVNSSTSKLVTERRYCARRSQLPPVQLLASY